MDSFHEKDCKLVENDVNTLHEERKHRKVPQQHAGNPSNSKVNITTGLQKYKEYLLFGTFED